MFSNFIYFLIALVIYTSAGLFEDGADFKGGVLFSSLMVNVLFVIVCRNVFRFLERKKDRIPFGSLDEVVNRNVSRLSILALIVFALNIYGFRLHLYLQGIRMFDIMPTLGALLFIGLFLFYLVVIWDASYRMQKAIFASRVTKKEYIVSNISFSLPALLPWFVLSIVADLLGLLPWPWFKSILASPTGELAYIAVFIIAIAIFGPVLIKRLWHCKPLETGDSKKRLETICDNAGLKYADILKWELFGGHMITAGVMGLVGRFRYILVTPALLSSLDEDQIEAVMLHEIGHVQKHHMLFYLLFFAGFIGCSSLFFEPIGLFLYVLPVYGIFKFIGIDQGVAHSILTSLTLIGFFILYFRLVFGLYMRNFERQADLHIYQYKNDASPLITTFYKIASYSRQSMEKPNWHHFSIGERVRFLEKCQMVPEMINTHHRKVKKLIAAYFAVVLVVCTLGYTINYGGAKEPFNDFITKKFLFQQLDLHPENSELYVYVGDYFYGRQAFQKAIDSYQNVLQVDPVNVHALNNLSMLFSTCSDEAFRNSKMALELAQKALAVKKEAFVWDTYAEALYANKDIANALAASKEAARLANDKQDFYESQIKRFEDQMDSSLLNSDG